MLWDHQDNKILNKPIVEELVTLTRILGVHYRPIFQIEFQFLFPEVAVEINLMWLSCDVSYVIQISPEFLGTF